MLAAAVATKPASGRGQVVPGKELPKLTEATSDSFVSTQEGRRVASGSSRATRGRGGERGSGRTGERIMDATQR